MLYLLFIIITLLISLIHSIQTRVWQEETYHLENRHLPKGHSGKLGGLKGEKFWIETLEERNRRVNRMINEGFLNSIIFGVIIAVLIFGVLLGLDYLEFINFLTN